MVNFDNKNIPPVFLWPDTGLAEVGPNELQKRYYINLMPPDKRPHMCTQDRLLSIGGFASGKTLGEINLAIDMGLMFPGLQCFIGAYDITMARRNCIGFFENAFRHPESGRLWKHPACAQGFGTKTNIMKLYNGSTYTFLNLKDAIARNVGFSSGILCIEEPHTLPDENSYLTLLSRARAKPPDVNQIILCTNPTRSIDSWLNNTFELHKFDGVDTSMGPVEKLVGAACTCHLCGSCALRGVEALWEKKANGKFECKTCGAIKGSWSWEGERFYCPGEQQYTRVVKSETGHNKHVDPVYLTGLTQSYDKQTVSVLVQGRTDMNLEDDQVYHKFDKGHILSSDEEIDWEDDIIWALDFNLKPACSTICQLDNQEGIIVMDEIVMSGPTMDEPYGKASSEDVAREFVRRYKHNYQGTTVKIFGDPKGFDGQTTRELTKYDKLIKILNDEGFITLLCADREQIPLKECIDTVNDLLFRRKIWVNPSCVHVVASFANLKWKERAEASDRPALDNSGDQNAARSNNRSRVYTMTHPTDGLRYACWKLLPMLTGLGRRSAVFSDRIVHEEVDGSSTVEYVDAPEATNRFARDIPPGLLQDEQVRAQLEVERYIEERRNQSFRSLLGGLGLHLPPPTPPQK